MATAQNRKYKLERKKINTKDCKNTSWSNKTCDMHDDVFLRVRNEKDLLLTCGAVYGPIVESAV